VNGISLNHMVLLNRSIILLTRDIAPSLNDHSRTGRCSGKFAFTLLQLQLHRTQVAINSDRCQQRKFYALDPFPHATPTAVLLSLSNPNTLQLEECPRM
jgi:hypothetical protein